MVMPQLVVPILQSVSFFAEQYSSRSFFVVIFLWLVVARNFNFFAVCEVKTCPPLLDLWGKQKTMHEKRRTPTDETR